MNPAEARDFLKKFKITEIVIEHDGRWDITFIENPKSRKGIGGISKFNIISLLAYADKHPKAWESLKMEMALIDLLLEDWNDT